jgi:Flp pilus assembly protein TadD
LLAQGDFSGVIALLENPAVRPQRTPLQSLNLATAYERSGKRDEALRVLRDGLNTAPDSKPLAEALEKIVANQGK